MLLKHLFFAIFCVMWFMGLFVKLDMVPSDRHASKQRSLYNVRGGEPYINQIVLKG